VSRPATSLKVTVGVCSLLLAPFFALRGDKHFNTCRE
jgi:hypothetical protein